jgi:1,4-alpha-glucan branching enzyme
MAQIDFQLFAPHIERAELIGSWLKEPVEMTKDDTGTWRTSSELPDGRHCYKFRLPSLSPFNQGKTVEITDPFARLIDDQNEDAGVILIQNGRDATTTYDWHHDDKPLPQDDELVLYELQGRQAGFVCDRD